MRGSDRWKVDPVVRRRLAECRRRCRNAVFPLDYSIRLQSIPTYLGERRPERTDQFDSSSRGKDVVIGVSQRLLGDRYFIPGYGRPCGVYVHAIGAETLKAGTPIDLGWIPRFLLALALPRLAVRAAPSSARQRASDLRGQRSRRCWSCPSSSKRG